MKLIKLLFVYIYTHIKKSKKDVLYSEKQTWRETALKFLLQDTS